MGEGSVCVVVEPLDKAKARGANIRWVVDGIGIANDGVIPSIRSRRHWSLIAIDNAIKQAGTQCLRITMC